MKSEPNYLLEYTIDSLLKAFNPYRKRTMTKSNFFKLMKLLDIRLKKQDIDIKLPGYWYQFGFYIELNFLDAVLPRSFNKFYVIDSKYIVPPLHPNKEYQKISDQNLKEKIDSTVHWLWKQYGFKSNYGHIAKKESYLASSPYVFNTIFQDYIDNINASKDKIENILDSLLSTFPEKEFPELYDIYLEWDDTTRLILDFDKNRKKLIRELMEHFWKTYSIGVKIRHNQNIPIPGFLENWKKEYEISINEALKYIENIRKNVLSDYYKVSGKNEELVRQLMKKAYDIEV